MVRAEKDKLILGRPRTGSAGALARDEREARNSYSVKRFEIERVAHAGAGEGTRAPSTNWLVPDQINFLGKA